MKNHIINKLAIKGYYKIYKVIHSVSSKKGELYLEHMLILKMIIYDINFNKKYIKKTYRLY